MCEDCSDVNLVRTAFLNLFLHLGLVGKGLVTDVDVILQREGELTVGKVGLGHCGEEQSDYTNNMKGSGSVAVNTQ